MKARLITLAFLTLTFSLSAQSVSFVNLTPDARTMGLAGATLALDANAYALYTNPAAMALSSQKMAAGVSYMQWQPNASNTSLLSVSGFGKIGQRFAVGLAGRYLNMPSYAISTGEGNINGTYKPLEYAVELGAAYQLAKGLSIGINARFIQSSLSDNYKDNAIAADVALQYQIKHFSVAAAVTNLGQPMEFGMKQKLPTLAKMGVAYSLPIAENHRITFSVEGDYHLTYHKGFMGGVGMEYAFKNWVAVRAGYHLGDELKVIPSYATVGVGFQVVGVSLEAAYIFTGADSPLKNSFSATLGYRF